MCRDTLTSKLHLFNHNFKHLILANLDASDVLICRRVIWKCSVRFLLKVYSGNFMQVGVTPQKSGRDTDPQALIDMKMD